MTLTDAVQDERRLEVLGNGRRALHRADAIPGTAIPGPRRAVRARHVAPSVVRRRAAHPLLMPYHRLSLGIILANVFVACTAPEFTSALVADLTQVNFVVAFAVRCQSIVNLLFAVVTKAPHRWPLAVRSRLARIYHHGGVHVGATVCGTVWTAVLAVLLVGERADPALLVTTGVLVLVLAAIVVLASPPVRHRHHDLFEVSHRYGGWVALAVLAVQTSLADRPVWPLIVLGALVVLPWLRLRRVAITVERPSGHVAIVSLADGTRPLPGTYAPISRHPLGQWHSFALVSSPGEGPFRVFVSRAGDWTRDFIDSPPEHVWLKGVPTAGVASVGAMFSSVLWVATGSGIAPVLPHLLARPKASHLLWIARAPRRTYGDALVEEVETSVEGVTLWDTARDGKPDTVSLARRVAAEVGAEAVIVISNKQLTWEVVRELTAHGTPAYGAIWDS